MAARTVTITGLGDFRQLQAELERTGVISAQSTKSITEGAATAGEAAAKQAEAMGASADEQEAAAARAASAYVEGAAKMTQAQKAAAAAAAAVAEANGASADEIVAASARAVEAQKALQDASMETAAAADASGARIGTAFEKGTTTAGNALTRLGETGASWGIPLAGSLTKMGKEFEEADSKATKFSSGLASAGKLAVTAGVVGFGVAAVEGVKGAVDLEKQMTRLQTQAGATGAQVKTLTGDVLNLHVGTGPQQASEALYHVVSALNATTPAAERTKVEMGVLETALKGAQVGGSNVVDTTNALDAAVISGLPGLGNYTHAMGALNTIVGAGDMTMQDLADALGTGLLAPMKNFGVSLQDIGGALAVFGDNNLRGAAAATKLTSAIRIMAAPSKTAAGYLAEVGISATELGDDIRSHGLVDALEDLKKHLEASGDTATQEMRVLSNAFGGRQATGVQILLAQLDRMKEKVKDVSQGGANFGMAWAERTHNLSYELDELGSSIRQDADKLGLDLIPKLEAAGAETGKVIAWFERNKGAAEALGVVVTGVLGAAVGAFAEQKAVAFYGGLTKMWGGLQTLASGVTSATSSIISRFAAQDEAVTVTAATTMTETEAIAGAYGSMSDAATVAAGEIEAADVTIVDAADTTAAGVDVAMGSTGVGAVLVLLGIAAVELEQHWGAVMTAMEEAAQAAANGIIKALNAAISVIETLSFGLLKISNISELSGAGEKPRQAGEGGKLSVSGSVLSNYGQMAERAAAKYGISSNVLLADIEEETGGNPNASSSKGAKGLTQFIPETAAKYGVKYGSSKADEESQIMGQAHYLASLGGQKNIKKALENYLGTEGPEGVAYAESVLGKAGTAGNEAVAKEVPKIGAEAQKAREEEDRLKKLERAQKEAEAGLTGGKGTPEPPTAAQEKATGAQEKAQEKAEGKAEKAKDKAESEAKSAAREAKEHVEKITKESETLLKKYEAEAQNSTPAAMEKALGVSTRGRFKSIPGLADKAAATDHLSGLEGELGKSAGASEAGKQESKLVTELKATHKAALEKMADEIAAAHKQALDTLAEEMVATEQLKLGEQLKVQATEEKDRTTQLEHTSADQLNIVKAEAAQQTDAMKAAASAIDDATQSMSDSFSALAESIEDQSKVMADSSNAVVTGIKDQTNIEVSILGERGLYGLNLIAQKEEVQLDQMKATYDQQIQQAKIAEDQLAATWQGVLAQDQQVVDEDKTQADVQEAKAQAHADAAAVLAAQQIAAAQAEVDAVQLAQDAKIGNAELKVLAAANESKAQQTTAASGLSFAEHEAEHQEALAGGHLKAAEAAGNAATSAAQASLAAVTAEWTTKLEEAKQALAKAAGESEVALKKAGSALQSIEGEAAKAEEKLAGEIAVTKERASTQYAGSGLVINQYGMNPENAAANASALGWELRSLLPI